MGTEGIVARILSDAEREAEEIVRAAEERKAQTVEGARARAAKEREEAEAELAERARRLSEGKAAAARLDSAKILLAEKRRVLDEMYARALAQLLALPEHDSLELLSRMLGAYAEEGDEVVFACDFPYAWKAAQLPVVKARKLKIAKERGGAGGGCILRNGRCDKDLTFSQLLAHDREEHQADLARKLFPVK